VAAFRLNFALKPNFNILIIKCVIARQLNNFVILRFVVYWAFIRLVQIWFTKTRFARKPAKDAESRSRSRFELWQVRHDTVAGRLASVSGCSPKLFFPLPRQKLKLLLGQLWL
jgi:hypothetical protein